MTFQERLNSSLEARGWRQSDLCKASGLSSAQATHLMNGRTKEPTLSTAAKIAEALDVSLDYLAGRTDNPAGICDEELEELRIDAETRAMLRGFSSLPPDGRDSIMEQVEFQQLKSAKEEMQDRRVPGAA